MQKITMDRRNFLIAGMAVSAMRPSLTQNPARTQATETLAVMLKLSRFVAATRYDALGLCCFGKATRLDTLERFRCRTVLVAVANDQFAVNRLRGKPPELMGRPNGPVSEQVAGLFTRT